MRVLYGVVGEGMGHATRSRVVLEHLLARGHEVLVVVSGRAQEFLRRAFAGRPNVVVREIHGLHLAYDEGGLDRSASAWENLREAPAGVRRNVAAYREVVKTFTPQAVVSDFESWAYLLGRHHDIPVVSIDNMQVLDRCRHDRDVASWRCFDFLLARLLVKAKLPAAYHYIVTSFFFPEACKPRTTLVPPILRPEILAARREPGSHVLVYQTSSTSTSLVPMLRSLPGEFRVYGMGREAVESNVSLRAFSQEGFVDDLRTARAAIAGGGFSLMGECVHLHVPLLSVPVERQYEQELNARYLAKLGYGAWASALDADVVARFLADLPRFEDALRAYEPRDNSLLFACVDELLERIGRGEPAPDRLEAAG